MCLSHALTSLSLLDCAVKAQFAVTGHEEQQGDVGMDGE